MKSDELSQKVMGGKTDVECLFAFRDIGDVFVTKRMPNGVESFWNTLHKDERLFFSLLMLVHHAGANGLQAMFGYNQGYFSATISCATEALDCIGEIQRSENLRLFLNWMRGVGSAFGVAIPDEFQASLRSCYEKLDEVMIDEDTGEEAFDSEKKMMENLDAKFIGCGERGVAKNSLEWIHKNFEFFSNLICEQ